MTQSFDLNNLPSDPRDKSKITSYNPNRMYEIRTYMIKILCQPNRHNFEFTLFSNKPRCLVKEVELNVW